MVIGLLFLEETHEDKSSRRDYGLEIGDWLLGFFCTESVSEKQGIIESMALLDESDDESSPAYSSTESSPALAPVTMGIGEVPPHSIAPTQIQLPQRAPKAGLCGALTKQVMLVIVSYGLVAYHTISAEQLLPIMLSLPKSSVPARLPFIFGAGFELSTKTIGSILSLQGVVQTFATLIFFPMVSAKLGTLWTFRLSIFSYPLLYLLVPYINVAPASLRMPALYLVIVWKVFAQAFALPPLQILLANSAPSKRVLGTLNGTAASSASLCRTFGPTLSGLIQSAGLSFNCLGLPWWSSCAVAILGAILSVCMVEPKRHQALTEKAAIIQSEAHAELHNAIERDPTLEADLDVEGLHIDRRG